MEASMTIRMLKLAGALCLALATVVSSVHADALTPVLVTPAEMTWTANPAGYDLARIAGNETTPGLYALCARFPAGLKLQPHLHPDERIVIVVSGTVYVGFGERFDEARMKALPAGSIWTEPARQPHFAWTRDGEAVIHIIGKGPTGTTEVPAKP
jgi:quercetin dioxygenase-like cupin family protein